MVRINISEARAGMELSCAVRAAQGFVILPDKSTLTVKNLSIIKSWGVELVDVKSASQELTPAIDDKYDQLIEEMFAPHEDNKLMLSIKQIAIKQHKKKK